eukprot:5620289-Pleurochrysis_carterae.AAC.1
MEECERGLNGSDRGGEGTAEGADAHDLQAYTQQIEDLEGEFSSVFNVQTAEVGIPQAVTHKSAVAGIKLEQCWAADGTRAPDSGTASSTPDAAVGAAAAASCALPGTAEIATATTSSDVTSSDAHADAHADTLAITHAVERASTPASNAAANGAHAHQSNGSATAAHVCAQPSEAERPVAEAGRDAAMEEHAAGDGELRKVAMEKVAENGATAEKEATAEEEAMVEKGTTAGKGKGKASAAEADGRESKLAEPKTRAGTVVRGRQGEVATKTAREAEATATATAAEAATAAAAAAATTATLKAAEATAEGRAAAKDRKGGGRALSGTEQRRRRQARGGTQ